MSAPFDSQQLGDGSPIWADSFAAAVHDEPSFLLDPASEKTAKVVIDLPENNEVLAIGSVASSVQQITNSPPNSICNDSEGFWNISSEIFGFRIREELGCGAFAKVFLAEELALQQRPVVLKVSAIDGDEPQTLAQMEHTGIVPIHSVHEDPKIGVRVVCMPYFGGATLARVLQELKKRCSPLAVIRGADIVSVLERVRSPRPSQFSRCAMVPPGHPPILSRMQQHSYAEAVAWIIAHVADALQHAHERGILHHDIKPSNILIADDGQPMLLDFNLAVSQEALKQARRLALGGTVSYMAPEQMQAMARNSATLFRHVDHRSDIYSLGIVLFELLTHSMPFERSTTGALLPVMVEAMALERLRSAPAFQRVHFVIPRPLKCILQKCLCPDPQGRYQRAEHLATDLRQYLADQPLRFARECLGFGCFWRWLRNHPRLSMTSSILALTLAIVAPMGAAYMHARSELKSSQLAEARDRKVRFEVGYQKSLCLINTLNRDGDHLRGGLEISADTLGIYGVLEDEDWTLHPSFLRLNFADRQGVERQVTDLMFARALGLLHTAEGRAEPLHEALALLDRIAETPGHSNRVRWELHAECMRRLGRPAEADVALRKARSIQNSTAHDWYWSATQLASEHRFGEAETALNESLRLDPSNYWSYMQRGLCREESGRHQLALGDYTACIAIWPEFAWGYFNRGRVQALLGENAQAIADFDTSLAKAPSLTVAWVERGMVELAAGRPSAALRDFLQARTLGADNVSVFAGLGLAYYALEEFEDAQEHFELVWRREPNNLPLRLAYAFAASAREPASARAAFELVLQHQPRNARAHYGIGMLEASKDRQAPEALLAFRIALDHDPRFVEARCAKANVLVHQGHWQQAREEIDACIQERPDGPTLYAAACVYALMAEFSSDPQQTSRIQDFAVECLRQALEKGVDPSKARTDADLAPLRQHPEFQRLTNPAVDGQPMGFDT